MQLVDEQDDVLVLCSSSRTLLMRSSNSLVLCTCNHTGQVKGNEPLVFEVIRYIAGHNLLRQTLGNSRLADTRVADQCRVVLGTAGQNLNDAVDLVLTADDGVELTLASSTGQILTVLVQRFSCAARRCAGWLPPSAMVTSLRRQPPVAGWRTISGHLRRAHAAR